MLKIPQSFVWFALELAALVGLFLVLDLSEKPFLNQMCFIILLSIFVHVSKKRSAVEQAEEEKKEDDKNVKK